MYNRNKLTRQKIHFYMDKQELLLLLAAPFIGHQCVSCATLSLHSGSHWGCSSSDSSSGGAPQYLIIRPCVYNWMSGHLSKQP